ncbi:MAG TPA: prepilin-type N-terminal cleavage/methylation domain-containing protein [Terrimicrobiaceae bacterium]
MRHSDLRRAGFTLVEIVLALAIFALLAGGIFAAVSAATRSTALVARDLSARRTMDAFIDFCRIGFANAGGAEKITVATRTSGGSGRIVEMTLRTAPDAFQTGFSELTGTCVSLAALPDGDGTATLSITRYAAELDAADVARYLDSEAIWIPLVAGVAKLRWQFLDPNSGKFEEDWSAAPPEIVAVMLEMTLADGSQTNAIFRIPRVARSLQSASNVAAIRVPAER